MWDFKLELFPIQKNLRGSFISQSVHFALYRFGFDGSGILSLKQLEMLSDKSHLVRTLTTFFLFCAVDVVASVEGLVCNAAAVDCIVVVRRTDDEFLLVFLLLLSWRVLFDNLKLLRLFVILAAISFTCSVTVTLQSSWINSESFRAFLASTESLTFSVSETFQPLIEARRFPNLSDDIWTGFSLSSLVYSLVSQRF